MKRVSLPSSKSKGKYTLVVPKFRTVNREGLTKAVSNLIGRRR